jgi:outer membrane immunogenic protein
VGLREGSIMMRVFVPIASTVILVAAASVVGAADLSRPFMPLAAPSYNWTGIYVGINGGGGWGRQDPLNIITDRFDARSFDISGGMFGATSGAQVQVANVVLGFESDIDWADISGSGTVTPTILGTPLSVSINSSTKLDWIGTARARAGLAQGNWLYYATGGLSLAEAKSSLTVNGFACGTAGLFCTGSGRKVGAAAGAGVEYGITPALSAKLEYLFIAAASVDISKVNSIRAGLNWRLGGN